MSERKARIARKTKETEIAATVAIDGSGQAEIATGLRFLDHLLDALTRHSRMDVTLTCKGDLDVDDHHTAEDCALALGAAIDGGLGERRGIARFGDAHAPLDEALARAVVDLSGRPHHQIDLGLRRERLGDVACESLRHVLQSLAVGARATLHVDVLRGDNDHHRVEAAFKATALALRAAVAVIGGDVVPSTKGVL